MVVEGLSSEDLQLDDVAIGGGLHHHGNSAGLLQRHRLVWFGWLVGLVAWVFCFLCVAMFFFVLFGLVGWRKERDSWDDSFWFGLFWKKHNFLLVCFAQEIWFYDFRLLFCFDFGGRSAWSCCLRGVFLRVWMRFEACKEGTGTLVDLQKASRCNRWLMNAGSRWRWTTTTFGTTSLAKLGGSRALKIFGGGGSPRKRHFHTNIRIRKTLWETKPYGPEAFA